MPLIQVPDIALKLKRRLALTFLPDSVLAVETVPVILVEDLTQGGTRRLCLGNGNAQGAAGETTFAVLRHATPAGIKRGYRMTCVGVWIDSSATAVIQISITGAPITGLTLSTSTSFADLDLVGRPASDLGVDTEVAMVARRINFRLRLIANRPEWVPLDIFMGSGVNQNSIIVESSLQNSNLNANFVWTEE